MIFELKASHTLLACTLRSIRRITRRAHLRQHVQCVRLYPVA